MYGNEQMMRAQGAGSVLGGGLAAAFSGDASRQAELPAQLANLEQAVTVAEQLLQEMAARLDGVVRPQTPQPASEVKMIAAAPPSSGYAAQLHLQTDRLHGITARMQDLLRRLEV